MALWWSNTMAVSSRQLISSHPNVHVFICHHGHCFGSIQVYHPTRQKAIDDQGILLNFFFYVCFGHWHVNTFIRWHSTHWLRWLPTQCTQRHSTLQGHAIWRHEVVFSCLATQLLKAIFDDSFFAFRLVYDICRLIVQFVMPLLVVFGVYLTIFWRLKNRPISQHSSNNKRRRRTNIMIISVSITFFLSWLPYNTLNFVLDLKAEQIQVSENSSLFLWALSINKNLFFM